MNSKQRMNILLFQRLFLIYSLFFPPKLYGTTVTIIQQSPVEVDPSKITLNDVVRCESPEHTICKDFSEITLADSPKPGQTILVGSKAIREKLASYFPSETFKFQGSTVSHVSRSFQLLEDSLIEQTLNERLSELSKILDIHLSIDKWSGPKDRKMPTGSLELNLKLADHIAKRLNRLNTIEEEDIQTQMDGKLWIALQLTQPIQWILEVKIASGPLKTFDVPLTTQLRVQKEIPVASRHLDRGAILQKEDFRLSYIELKSGMTPPVLNSKNLIGQKIRRSFTPETPFAYDDLERPVAIKRNQMVQLEMENGSLEITSQVKALESGGVGDVISVIGPSKKKLSAVVVNPGLVRYRRAF